MDKKTNLYVDSIKTLPILKVKVNEVKQVDVIFLNIIKELVKTNEIFLEMIEKNFDERHEMNFFTFLNLKVKINIFMVLINSLIEVDQSYLINILMTN